MVEMTESQLKFKPLDPSQIPIHRLVHLQPHSVSEYQEKNFLMPLILTQQFKQSSNHQLGGLLIHGNKFCPLASPQGTLFRPLKNSGVTWLYCIEFNQSYQEGSPREIPGLFLCVKGPDGLLERNNSFLVHARDNKIKNLTDEEFETSKRALIKILEQKDLKLSDEVSRRWIAITDDSGIVASFEGVCAKVV